MSHDTSSMEARNKQIVQAAFDRWTAGPAASSGTQTLRVGRVAASLRMIILIGLSFFDAAGMALDGKPYEQTYTWYLQMKDGKIVDVVAFFCTATFNDFWSRIQPAQSASQ